MRLIDSDIFDAIVNDDGTIDENATETVKNAMLAMPAVDAVPVIRCRDCKFYSDDYRGANPEWHLCTRTKAYRTTDDYCSRAERKEE